ncbi:MAG: hypothetical protein RSD36_08885 [Terrisporobacter sp.]
MEIKDLDKIRSKNRNVDINSVKLEIIILLILYLKELRLTSTRSLA